MYSVLYIIPGQLFLEETPSSSHMYIARFVRALKIRLVGLQ